MTLAQRLSNLPIVWKMTLVASIGMSLAVTAATWGSFNKSKDLLLNATIEHMQDYFIHQQELLEYSIEQVRQDAVAISHSSIIKEIIRAERSNNSVPTDNPDTRAWKTHLEQSFSNIIQSKGYQQIRLIRLEDGKEIVRVDAPVNGELPHPRRGNELQTKASSFYIAKGRRLAPGESYISSITLNREHGKIEQPWHPTQRFIAPVFAIQHRGKSTPKSEIVPRQKPETPYGILVINSNTKLFMGNLKKTDSFQITLTNSTAGIIHHSNPDRAWGFEFGDKKGIKSEHKDAWDSLIKNKSLTTFWNEQDEEIHVTGRIPLSTTADDHFFGLILTAKNKDILATVNNLGIRTQLIALLAILFVGTATIFMVRRLTHPIKELTEQASMIASGNNETKIVIQGTDEIGKLGSTFANLVEKLQHRRKEAEQKALEINRLNTSLEEKVTHRTAELAKQQTQLAHEVAIRTTFNSLLEFSLNTSSTKELAQYTLETILSLPFLNIQNKGAILLTGEDQKALTMIAAKNLDQSIQEICTQVSKYCLCGQAAKTRKTQFISGIDSHHIAFDEIKPHLHTSIPIQTTDSVLGIICLYFSHNTDQREEDLEFIEATADILANALTRLTAEENLHKSIHETNQALLREKKVSKALEAASRAANAANQTKGNFLATMSHEIRTPMNGILGMAELLQDTKLNQEQQEYLGIIHQSGNILLNIINDILDFSKNEAGKLELESKLFDLELIAHDTTRLMAHKAEKQGIKLVLDYDQACPRQLYGDPGRIQQVLLNLLSNAIKFTHEGQATVTITCTEQRNKQANILFSIKDTGIGIKPEAQKDLFQLFTQADNSTTRKYGGTGLGLAICKQIVEQMEGKIGVNSTLGKGSTFWFSIHLPCTKAVSQRVTADGSKHTQQLDTDPSRTEKRHKMPSFTDQTSLTSSASTLPIDESKLDVMRDLLGDDFNELILAFIESGESITKTLPEVYAEKNTTEVLRLTHSLKSAAANVGATRLSTIASEAEEHVRNNDLAEGIEKLISDLQSEFTRVRLALEAEQ